MGKKSSKPKKKSVVKTKVSADIRESPMPKGKGTSAAGKAKGNKQNGEHKTKETPSVSIHDLILKKFESWIPAPPFSVTESDQSNFTAPPFAEDPKQLDRIRPILKRSFDYKSFPEKPVSIPELLSKTFELWKPEALFNPPSNDEFNENFSAPPLIDTGNDAENERIKKLLFQEFDISKFPEPPPKPVSMQELLSRTFIPWKPTSIFSIPQDETYHRNFSSPPFFESENEAERERIKELLFLEFDLSKFPEPIPEPVSIEELLARQFGVWIPEQWVSVPPDKDYMDNFTAPPLIHTEMDAERDRLRQLLFQQFIYSDFPSVPPTPAVTPAPEAPLNPTPTVLPEIEEPPPTQPEISKSETSPETKILTQKKESEPKVVVSYKPPKNQKKGAEPMDKTLKYLIAAFAIIVLIIILASSANVGKYYMCVDKQGIEIWKGTFAPMGAEIVVRLPGAAAPETVKETYSKNEIFPIAANYYLNQADALLLNSEVPNLELVKSHLNKASKFASSEETRKEVYYRLSQIDLYAMLYRVDIVASKATTADYEKALRFLDKTSGMKYLTENQKEMIAQRKQRIEKLIQDAPKIQAPIVEQAVEETKEALPEETVEVPADETIEVPEQTLEVPAEKTTTLEMPQSGEQKIVTIQEKIEHAMNSDIEELPEDLKPPMKLNN